MFELVFTAGADMLFRWWQNYALLLDADLSLCELDFVHAPLRHVSYDLASLSVQLRLRFERPLQAVHLHVLPRVEGTAPGNAPQDLAPQPCFIGKAGPRSVPDSVSTPKSA